MVSDSDCVGRVDELLDEVLDTETESERGGPVAALRPGNRSKHVS